MSRRKLLQKELAQALRVSPGLITRLKLRGMPTHSVEAARRWREINVDPARAKWPTGDTPRRVSAAPAKVQADDLRGLVAHIDGLALQAVEKFSEVEPYVRAAMKALPPSHRDSVKLPLEVWGKLVADFNEAMASLDAADSAIANDESSEAISGDEADFMGRFWYAVAIGDIRANTKPTTTTNDSGDMQNEQP